MDLSLLGVVVAVLTRNVSAQNTASPGSDSADTETETGDPDDTDPADPLATDGDEASPASPASPDNGSSDLVSTGATTEGASR